MGTTAADFPYFINGTAHFKQCKQSFEYQHLRCFYIGAISRAISHEACTFSNDFFSKTCKLNAKSRAKFANVNAPLLLLRDIWWSKF